MDLFKKLLRCRWLVQAVFLAMTVFSFRVMPPKYGKFVVAAFILFLGTCYCGWVCAFGTLEDWLFALGRRFTKFEITVPRSVDRYLCWLRYVTLFVTLAAVFAVADARHTMLGLLGGRMAAVAAVCFMAAVLLLSLVMRRPFCRYLCPEGARYGAMSLARLFTVTRNADKCVNCRLCDRNCPMAICVSGTKSLLSPQCVSCGRCIAGCPREGALSLKFRELTNPWSWAAFAAGAFFIVKMVMFAARRFG